MPRQLLNRLHDRHKHIRRIVVVVPLNDGGDAFEAHAGIDVLRRQGGQLAVGAAVELDEYQVPDFDHARIAGVDERAAALVGRQINVNLAARSARTRIAHLPEVVLLVAGMDALGRQDPQPQFAGFVIGLEALGFSSPSK